MSTQEAPFRHIELAYQLHFYLCFKTHYLRPLFAAQEVEVLSRSVIDDVCARHDNHLLDIQVSPDHLRLLVSLKPEQTVSRAVQMFKGNLSRQFSAAFPGVLAQHRTKTPWAKGYFARNSGKVDLETIPKYVEQQSAHHGYRGEWASALR